MNSSTQQISNIWRLCIGLLGSLLLTALTISAYVAHTVNAAYFPHYRWPAYELYDVLWLCAGTYLLFVAFAGRWR
jgi:hypothetical protein